MDRDPGRRLMEKGGAVAIHGVGKRFGETTALDDVSLSIEAGGFVSLLGQSGSGKTTLLRIIAGLETPDRGRVEIGGRDVTGLPAHARPVNTVFQSYALFPHMTVRANVGFGLRQRGVRGAELTARVDRMLESLGVLGLAERKPGQISGGERQRTALARALVNQPQVLLLDEPLSALDPGNRAGARDQLTRVAAETGSTFVMVTHDHAEALALSSKIALMSHGRLLQVGTPQALYQAPECIEAAEAFGAVNRLPGAAGEGVVRILRPEAIRFGAPGDGEGGATARLEAARFLGETREWDFRLDGGERLLVRAPAASAPQLEAGAEASLSWRLADVRTLRR
jgi:ABC-type Fe3+/spermidine/putrescine transport system ATPase subunit